MKPTGVQPGGHPWLLSSIIPKSRVVQAFLTTEANSRDETEAQLLARLVVPRGREVDDKVSVPAVVGGDRHLRLDAGACIRR